jgi:hypothetical protein
MSVVMNAPVADRQPILQSSSIEPDSGLGAGHALMSPYSIMIASDLLSTIAHVIATKR